MSEVSGCFSRVSQANTIWTTEQMLNNKQLINTKVWNKGDVSSSRFDIHWQFLLQHVKPCRSPSDEVVYSGLELNATAPNEQAARLSFRVFNERASFTERRAHSVAAAFPLTLKHHLHSKWHTHIHTMFNATFVWKGCADFCMTYLHWQCGLAPGLGGCWWTFCQRLARPSLLVFSNSFLFYFFQQ